MKAKTLRCIKRLSFFVVLLFFSIGAVWLTVCAATPPSRIKAEHLLRKDEALLNQAVEVLKDCSGDVYFHVFFSRQSKEIPEMNRIATKLFIRGYKMVYKEGDTIVFTRWTRWKDFGAGLARVITETGQPSIGYLTTLEPIPQTVWFYYESN